MSRCQAPGHVQHGIAPRPEIVAFRASPHGALESMAVDVDEARERERAGGHWGEPNGHVSVPGTGAWPFRRRATIPFEMATRAVSAPLAQLPNALTVARLAIIPVFVALAVQAAGDASWPAGVLFGVAGVTDQIDGWLARRWRVESRFGRFVDPLADRIIIDAAVILLFVYDRLPWPALAIILVRDAVLVLGTPAALRRGYEFSVNFLGKIATWVLYASIAFILVTDKGTDWPLYVFWTGVALALAAGTLYLTSVWRTVRS
jgi:cardiolipin synthase (CMP-forming)